MSNFEQQLTNVGKPVWIALMIVGFLFWWPAGVAILAYLAWTGRLGAWTTLRPWAPQFWRGSGNAAFDEHRTEMLAKLEAEQREFAKFVDDVRKAKDKSEFDAFMTKRKARK